MKNILTILLALSAAAIIYAWTTSVQEPGFWESTVAISRPVILGIAALINLAAIIIYLHILSMQKKLQRAEHPQLGGVGYGKSM